MLLDSCSSMEKNTEKEEIGDDTSFSTRTSILDAYQKGTTAAIQNVVDELNRLAAKRVETGFNEINFTLGVSNCFLIVVFFSAFPQHFWLLYLIEGYANVIFVLSFFFLQLTRKFAKHIL